MVTYSNQLNICWALKQSGAKKCVDAEEMKALPNEFFSLPMAAYEIVDTNVKQCSIL